MLNDQVVVLIAVPLLLAFFLPVMARRCKLTNVIAPAVLIAMIAVAVSFLFAFEKPFIVELGGFAAPLGIIFYIDQLSLWMLLLIPVMTLLLWPWQSLYQGSDRGRELALYMIMVAACSGLAMSGDLFNLYVFYELLAVASFGLVISSDKGMAYLAGYRYLLISAMGSVMALLGIAIIYFLTGTLTLAHLASLPDQLSNPPAAMAFVLILLGFGVKAEMFPVNAWVPEVYQATKTRVAALLAGLVSKLAVIIILKVVTLVMPAAQMYSLLLMLGLAGLIIGELSALRANTLIQTLSWSSIGQLGLVFIAFSVDSQVGLMAGIALMLHHLLVKPALFLIVENWSGSISGLTGFAKKSPLASILFVLFALSLLGVPPFPGFWAKYLLLNGLLEADGGLYQFAVFAVLAMTVVEAIYLFRIITTLYDMDATVSKPVVATAWTNRLSILILATGLLAAVWQISPLADALAGVAAQMQDTSAIIQLVAGKQGALQ